MIKRNKTIVSILAFAMVTSILQTSISNLNTLTVRAEEVKTAPQLGVDSIKDVIAAMTLDEKANLLVGGNRTVIGDEPVIGGQSNTVPGAAGSTQAIPRLGIPSITLADGPAGLRISPTRKDDENTYYCTAFPISTSIASSWDVDLATEVGDAMGEEIKEYGVDILLAPALNIHRNPLNGRNFEYYSEDPLVSGKITAALSNGVQNRGVGVTLKHFAVNNQETNRQNVNAVLSERALREIYLRGFEIATKESQPWAFMSSYNKINGTFAAENPELLTDILREEWEFDGLVMTDWGGGKNTAAAQVAQNDLMMPGNANKVKDIINAVNNGTLSESDLDRNVENMLNLILKTPVFNNYKYSDKPDLEKNAEVSRKTATDGMVLLKNENKALPIESENKIAIYGTSQIETIKGGTGSGDVYSAYVTSVLDGFRKSGYTLQEDLASSYKEYIDTLRSLPEYEITEGRFGKVIPVIPEMEITLESAREQANLNDIGVIVIGRNSGEFADRVEEKGDYYLTDREQENIENISTAYHEVGKKVVVLLNIGGSIEMDSWSNKVDSILVTWQPGQEAGDAIVDVVSGKVNPSGKLATTFSKSYEDNPSSDNFPGDDPVKPTEVVHEEDLYVGYRYFSTFNVEPSYEFGHGLSYTTFNYSDVTLNKNVFDGSIEVSVIVTNSGDVAGKEVVQVYLNEPDGKLEKPEIQLREFGKTDLLQPGESQKLTFTLDEEAIKSYDEELSNWIVEKGTYEVRVGASSEDIKGTAKFKVREDILVEDINNKIVQQKEIDKLVKPVKEIIVTKAGELMASVTSTTVNLSWTDPTNDYGLVEYVIYKDGKELAVVEDIENSYTVDGLKSNTIYGFKVVAKYSNGLSSKPISINVRTTK